MSLVIPCPSCQAKLKVPEGMIGKKVKCPSCQNAMTVRDPGATPARSRAPAPREDEVFDDLEVDDRPPRPAARRGRDDEDDRPRRDSRIRRDRDEDDYDDRPRGRRDRDDDYDGRDEDDRPRRKRRAGPSGGATTDSERSTAMLLWLLSLLGVGIVSLILWLMKRTESRYIDHHGKMWLNMVITALLESFILFLFVGIGITGFILRSTFMGVAGLALAGLLGTYMCFWSLIVQILGLIKGKNGEWWSPPMTLKLFK